MKLFEKLFKGKTQSEAPDNICASAAILRIMYQDEQTKRDLRLTSDEDLQELLLDIRDNPDRYFPNKNYIYLVLDEAVTRKAVRINNAIINLVKIVREIQSILKTKESERT